MSEPGPSEHSSRLDRATSPSFPSGHVPSTGHVNATQNMSHSQPPLHHVAALTATKHATVQTTPASAEAPIEMRVHFDEFAAQLRLHRHSHHKRRMLEHRRTHLQKAVALSGRLRRLSSWLHDGLVEISKFPNTADFVRVHEHLLNLTDVCFSRWDHDIRAFDSVTNGASQPPTPHNFLSQLSPTAQNDCIDFIRNVRSNPRFLVTCFKTVSTSQLVALSTAPRYTDISAYISTFSGSRGRSSHKKRIQSFAKNLEEYAATFERKNPMSFLLHNCYGVGSASEDRLRVETWSTICASLYVETGPPFLAFFHQILWEFAGLSGWRAKDRLELFLMDILQRGAFLLEPIGDIKKGALDSYIADTLEGDQARNFFDDAVRELFAILSIEDGGFPEGVLQLTRAILAKLPDVATQGRFRGDMLGDWFLRYFLENAITFPENQKMLLQFHISDSARSTILRQLWHRACLRAEEVLGQGSVGPPDEFVQSALWSINNQLSAEVPSQEASAYIGSAEPPSCISVCASELIHTLEALSQQYTNVGSHFEPFVQTTLDRFRSLRSRESPKLDKLRRELQLLFEPGHSSTAVHTVDEQWVLVPLTPSGQPTAPAPAPASEASTVASLFNDMASLNPAQKAAIRLAAEADHVTGSLSPSPAARQGCFRDLLVASERDARSTADGMDAHFWASAAEYLDDNYPLAFTSHAESRLLRPLLTHLRRAGSDEELALETQVMQLEREYQAAKEVLITAGTRIEHLKMKLWYVTSVVVSGVYENAQNITKALAYMWLATPPVPEPAYSVSSGSRDRPSTSASTTSSLFEQPRLDTMKILKAPKEHGGPKKLADEQIELTKKWLARNEVDNFCKGEERIHRFCMEIQMATRRLVADSAVESPDLWSSDLWAREKNLFEGGPIALAGLAASTRPSSVVSEAPSSAPWARPVLGSAASSRSFDADLASSPGRKGSVLGQGGPRISPSIPGSDLASLFAVEPRSATTASVESIFSASTKYSSQARSQTSNSVPSRATSIWSQSSGLHPSRSQTSASFPSRPPSIYSEVPQVRISDTAQDKAKFLETMRKGLTVLLLSDLGNPVWSLGSETDAWLDSQRRNPHIAKRLSRRQQMSRLVPFPPTRHADTQTPPSRPRPKGQRRTWSADDARAATKAYQSSEVVDVQPDDRALDALDDVLKKIGRRVDPNAKLQAVYEFRQLAALCLERQTSTRPAQRPMGRRQSLGTGSSAGKVHDSDPNSGASKLGRSENEMRDYLRDILHALEPKTLFRDLQYIAAFTSLDTLNKTESGKAFVQVGLAALSSKDEVCRAMVELADRIITRDGIKRRASAEDAEHSLNKARDYWIIAAKEGNAVAQRELASLYLAHPEISVPPTVTAPLWMSSEVFRSELMWRGSEDDRNRHALCLALHWMRLASDNGDTIAKQKVAERKGKATA